MTPDPLHIAVIVGSTREGRFAPTVAGWLTRQAALHPDIELDVIDLADVELPAVLTGRRDDATAAYAARIDRADGYVVVTPEYNHGYPAALKHAVDLCHGEWRGKAAAFVSYGGMSGGIRAVEQLRQVFAELHVATVRDGVTFHMVGGRFDEHGEPYDPEACNAAAATMLDQLVWWASALRTARRADRATATAAVGAA
jgi:NAD(P)H-dependent FMN reductase